jgi:hypothetical protein
MQSQRLYPRGNRVGSGSGTAGSAFSASNNAGGELDLYTPTSGGTTSGDIIALPVGGSGNYTYSWVRTGNAALVLTGAATKTVTVTDTGSGAASTHYGYATCTITDTGTGLTTTTKVYIVSQCGGAHP